MRSQDNRTRSRFVEGRPWRGDALYDRLMESFSRRASMPEENNSARAATAACVSSTVWFGVSSHDRRRRATRRGAAADQLPPETVAGEPHGRIQKLAPSALGTTSSRLTKSTSSRKRRPPALAGGLGADSPTKSDSRTDAPTRRDGMRLMPPALHTWMDPNASICGPTATRESYDAFDGSSRATGHALSAEPAKPCNQLPFHGDEGEFRAPHAANPVPVDDLPGLGASSPPIVDGGERTDSPLTVGRVTVANCAECYARVTGEWYRSRRARCAVPRERARTDLRDLARCRSRGVRRKRNGSTARRHRAFRRLADRDTRARCAGTRLEWTSLTRH